MADLGTSVGLQGTYQGDSANNPAFIKPKENKSADMFVDYLDKEEAKKQKELENFDKQISPYMSIDGSKYLPERVPLVREQALKVMQEATSARGRTKNIMFDANVQKEVTKLQELQNKYSKEALIANEFQKKVALTDQAFEYDDNVKEEIAKAIEGRAGLDDKKYISLEMIDKGRNYSKYRKPEERAKFLQFHTPDANKEVVVRRMVNGNYVDENVKGSEIYSTPEGVEIQRQKFEQLSKSSQNPFVKGYLREAQEEIDANNDLVFQENFKDLTPLEAQDFISKRASELMLRDAMANNKLKTTDKTTKIPTGSDFTQNFGGLGGVQTADGVFIPKESPLPTEEDLSKAWEKKNNEYYEKWLKADKELTVGKHFTKEERIERYKKELSKPSKNDPTLTIEEWNKKQLEKSANNANQGLTAISFTPKGKDNWFEATATDGKARKIIPKTIYKNSNGELVKIEGYNVDESTEKVKIDLEEFEIDAKNEKNRNSFIGKYPTSVKSAGLNIPTKVIVSEKQNAGVIQGKAAPQKEAAKPMTQDEFNKKWASLKKGESIVAPNGQTYKKK